MAGTRLIQSFTVTTLVPYSQRRTELEHRSPIRKQAFGESHNGEKLEVPARYEVHRDRKLERILTMLARLKELRRQAGPGEAPFGKNAGRCPE